MRVCSRPRITEIAFRWSSVRAAPFEAPAAVAAWFAFEGLWWYDLVGVVVVFGALDDLVGDVMVLEPAFEAPLDAVLVPVTAAVGAAAVVEAILASVRGNTSNVRELPVTVIFKSCSCVEKR